MQSSLIGKLEKAKLYAQERDRITFTEFKVKFRGGSDDYEISFEDGKWHCTCNFFSTWDTCSHSMAMERVLENMLPEEALVTPHLT